MPGGLFQVASNTRLWSLKETIELLAFYLDDSLMIDYERVMHSTKMRTDIIALEDSEIIVIPAKIMREKLNSDHELNMNLMMGLFEQLYDQFLDFCSHTPTQRYLRLLTAILDN